MDTPANNDIVELKVAVGVLQTQGVESNRRLQNIELLLANLNYVKTEVFEKKMETKVDKAEWATYKRAIWALVAFAMTLIAWLVTGKVQP